MKNKFSFFYTTFAIIFYTFCICFFSFNIIHEYKSGDARIQETIDALVSEIKVSNQTPVLTEYELTAYNTLTIYFNGYNIFDFSKNNSNNSTLIKNVVKSFETTSGKFFIEANVYLLRPYSIFYYARISFILILIFSFITISLIVLLPSHDKIPDIKIENINYDENTEESFSDKASVSDMEIHSPISETSENAEPVEQPAIVEEENHESSSIAPEGLFSPVTGFGWESYLKDRLDNEISRAISSESDLAVYVINIPNIERTASEIKEICDYLLVQFQFKDLIFEYMNDCFVILQNNTSIDDALSIADKLINNINKFLENTTSKCFIGITSKSIRIVSGERLLKEATEALNHAKESDESSVVAFQVNSDKYLEFIEKQN